MATSDDRPAHHRADGTFANPPGSPKRDFSTVTFLKFFVGRMFDRRVPEVPLGIVLADADVAAGLEAAGNPGITWLGHAAFLIRLGGKTILTDPYLGETAGPAGFGPRRFVPPAVPVDELPPIDILAISHNHYDHLDAWTIDRLAGRDRMTVVVPLGLGEFFTSRGYAKVVELDWYQSHDIGEVTVTALPAVHFSRRGLGDANRTLWASFAISGPEARIWFSGDTAYGEVFADIGERQPPFDLALVGIGAYEPREIMKSSHATPEEAVSIARDLNARRVMGMHWGTVKLTPEDPFEAPGRFRAAARAAGYMDDDVWLMRIGETRTLPRRCRNAPVQPVAEG